MLLDGRGEDHGPLRVISHIVADEPGLATRCNNLGHQALAIGITQVGGNHCGAALGQQTAGG